jgi:hypothetical protein
VKILLSLKNSYVLAQSSISLKIKVVFYLEAQIMIRIIQNEHNFSLNTILC